VPDDIVSDDISPILGDWPYRPDEITVRITDGLDGRRKIQLRLDLGILQMEFDGRPDGRRIHECDSWFAFHLQRQKEHDQANPDSAPYVLEPEDCQELLREGVQYYHRYLSFWHLGTSACTSFAPATQSATCGYSPSSASTRATTGFAWNSTSGGPT
jgi:hypothetical protein